MLNFSVFILLFKYCCTFGVCVNINIECKCIRYILHLQAFRKIFSKYISLWVQILYIELKNILILKGLV